MDVLINQIGGILSQCVHIPKLHNVYFIYLTILYVNLLQ